MSKDIWDEVHNSKKCIMLYAMEESFPDSTGLSRSLMVRSSQRYLKFQG